MFNDITPPHGDGATVPAPVHGGTLEETVDDLGRQRADGWRTAATGRVLGRVLGAVGVDERGVSGSTVASAGLSQRARRERTMLAS
jgi:hypothetical protein